MRTFHLTAHVTVSANTSVRANSLTEAIEMAEARGVVIGGAGSGADETEDWVIEEADGAPTNIHA